ncbi:hypothetical protein N7491_000196 [Penicillium cf. griseofulvum]|uniref:Uncharacterized protein n=1 Tax=Penicillium cf. griseofulvum TaxID=2972120 RepID=A0A9W9JLQ4_9EURO|nr:hypothetical protein N7472_004452 [Penicillium cf. griseofulvum]KAJ5442014.1 hypothetical protein N7445_005021 [Penicillium cf. griseofulvum]KAJ5451014.1 hypothetical protein N7491_000196 [Penicillium cf. griseofulvum]
MPVDGFTETMNTPDGGVFHRAYAQDDRGLENEAMAVLTGLQDGKQLFLEKDYFINHMKGVGKRRLSRQNIHGCYEMVWRL